MEKAKEFIQTRHLAGCGLVIDRNTKMGSLKPDINNLLHTYLPGDITLDEAEALAMCINDIIWNPRDYLPTRSAKPPLL